MSPVAAESVQHSGANSTLNMSLLRPSHATRGGGEKNERKRGGGKAPRETNPPLFDALMLIHSERTSCLSAYTASLLCLSLCFRGLFSFPSHPASPLPSTLRFVFISSSELSASFFLPLPALLWKLFISQIHLLCAFYS